MQEEFVEDLPRQQSYLEFFFGALGFRYTLLLPLAALLAFVLVLVLILRGKGNSLPAALMLIVPLPILVGIIGLVDGTMTTLTVLSMDAPLPTQIAQGISMSLVTVWNGRRLVGRLWSGWG